MKWLNSLDEFLYEVMSWIVFFPKTMWSTVRRPLATMDYADRQLRLPQEEQYPDALSPPLFLALALMVAHAVATALGQTDALVADRHGLSGLINDQTSALLFRLLIFAAFPLLMALRFVRRQGLQLDRNTLRFPFYAQCYPAATFAFGLSLGFTLAHVGSGELRYSGYTLAGISLVHYAMVEARWFAAQLGTGLARGVGAAVFGLIEGFALLVVAGLLFAS